MNSARILVVDDNATNVKLAGAVLKFAGHQVSTASDAAEALKAISSVSFDLIVMDIAMPGMDGLALTRLLKDDPSRQHIPIVAVTASAMKGDDQKAFDAGCDGYITKPIDTRLFPRQIAKFLSASFNSSEKSRGQAEPK